MLIGSSIADPVGVTLLAINGQLTAPVSLGLIAALLVVVIAYRIVVDQLKVVIFRLFEIH